MIYLNENDIKKIGLDWQKITTVIEEAVLCLHNGDFSQPIKPYLRYRDLKNRIIAMPAFLGGNVNAAGIKWIASFPDNIDKGMPRAHSVVILNQADTGEPIGIINTALLSVIRTASVSGLVLRYFEQARTLENMTLGIIGFGPIGQYHLKMCKELLASKLAKIYIYDIRKIDPPRVHLPGRDEIVIADSWQQAYEEADVFITCTVAKTPYIHKPPKKGSLHLNVSLRDYKTEIYDYVKDSLIVDDWEEVCREQTDIERMYREKGLSKEDTKSIIDVVVHNCLKDYGADVPIMFNPMGMAVFDIAAAAYYMNEAHKKNIGLHLR